MKRGKWPLLIIAVAVLFVMIPVAIGYGPVPVTRQELSDSLSGYATASALSDTADAVRADINDTLDTDQQIAAGWDFTGYVQAKGFGIEDTTEADSLVPSALTAKGWAGDSADAARADIVDSIQANVVRTGMGIWNFSNGLQAGLLVVSGKAQLGVGSAIADTTEVDSALISILTARAIAGDSASNNDVYVHVYRGTSDQTLGYNAFDTVEYNTELEDWGNDFNTTTFTFTAPDSAVYIISAGVLIEDNGGTTTDGYGQIGFYRNDSLFFLSDKVLGQVAATDITAYSVGPTMTVSLYMPVGATFHVEAIETFDSGGGLIIDDMENTWLTIRKEN